MKKQTRKQASSEALYFVGVLPPPAIQEEVTAFKQTALERFNAGHALTSPPHITLLPPFRSSRTDFGLLRDFAGQNKTMEVRLTNFDRFDQRVIFIHVEPTDALTALQKELELYAHYHLGIEPEYRPFHPHMTVAFKDLKRPVFPQAWDYYSKQTYQRTFTAEALSLLKFNGQVWEVNDQWQLGEN